MTPALASIDLIPWPKLYSFHGNAGSIPEAIKRLYTNAKDEDLEEIFKTLESALHYPDEICQATPFATPYLLPLLGRPCSNPFKIHLLGLLTKVYKCAMFGPTEMGLKVGVDQVEDPEQYRGDNATLGDGEFTHAISQDEIFSWEVLVHNDFQQSRETIESLANLEGKTVGKLAVTLLKYVDDYYGEREKEVEAALKELAQ